MLHDNHNFINIFWIIDAPIQKYNYDSHGASIIQNIFCPYSLYQNYISGLLMLHDNHNFINIFWIIGAP
jgi:hypothetical protein